VEVGEGGELVMERGGGAGWAWIHERVREDEGGRVCGVG